MLAWIAVYDLPNDGTTSTEDNLVSSELSLISILDIFIFNSGMNNIVSSDRVSVSSKVSQYRTIQNLKQFQLRNDSTRMHITVKNLSKATDRLTDYCYY